MYTNSFKSVFMTVNIIIRCSPIIIEVAFVWNLVTVFFAAGVDFVPMVVLLLLDEKGPEVYKSSSSESLQSSKLNTRKKRILVRF